MHLLADIWNHPANRDKKVASLIRAARWQLTKRVNPRAIDIPFHGLRLRCHPDSHSASRAIYFGGLPDYREMRFMLDYLREGDRFIDVGANIGLYTLLALSIVGQAGHVDAFEPGAATAARLRDVLLLNGVTNATVHEVAVSDVTGTAELIPTTDDCTAHLKPGAESGSSGNAVETVRLDSHLPNVPYALIKLDIEGHEPMALRGASAWLEAANPPVLLIEMAGYSKRFGVTTADFIQELDVVGYDTGVYEPEARSLQWTNRPWEIPVENVLAVSRKRRELVMDRIGSAPAS